MKNFFLLLALTAWSNAALAQSLQGTLWDIPALYRAPASRVLQKDSAIALVYQGLPYHGHQQEVFAWYATPGTLSGDTSKDHHLPGIVLVHGGGGAAFREWAIMWAQRGFAAIAMDLRGNGPDRKHLPLGFEEPGNETPYFDVTLPLQEQWMYHAVANVLLAHQLLRSFPAVDTNRTALTGISWGGVITCTVAGLDPRFRAAVPVYGCGYLGESGRMRTQLKALTEAQRHTWLTQYDPSQYIGKAAMPMLFVNGTNDPHFEMESYARTCALVKHQQQCIKPGMKHSHKYGWANAEISAFINSYVNDSLPLPAIGQLSRHGGYYRALITTGTPILKSDMHYTTDTAGVAAQWKSMEVKVNKKQLQIPLPPAGATAWFISVEDERGMYISGPLQHQFLK